MLLYHYHTQRTDRIDDFRDCTNKRERGCRGFLSTAWKCGLCENWTCPHCFELKGLQKDDPNNPIFNQKDSYGNKRDKIKILIPEETVNDSSFTWYESANNIFINPNESSTNLQDSIESFYQFEEINNRVAATINFIGTFPTNDSLVIGGLMVYGKYPSNQDLENLHNLQFEFNNTIEGDFQDLQPLFLSDLKVSSENLQTIGKGVNQTQILSPIRIRENIQSNEQIRQINKGALWIPNDLRNLGVKWATDEEQPCIQYPDLYPYDWLMLTRLFITLPSIS